MIFFRILIVSISILFFSGCATPSTNTPASTNDVKRFPGTYSMYGRSVQFDDEKKVYYVDVFVGGSGNRLGSEEYAKTEIMKFGQTQGFKNYAIVDSEYSLFPLSKFRLYFQYSD